MHKEVYEFDLQNKMEGNNPEGGPWPLEDGIRVKCWKLLPSKTSETDRWSRADGNQTLPAFQLKIGGRCNGGADKLEECKKNSSRTLPVVSWMKDGLMYGTSGEDIYCNISSEPRASAKDMIQIAHLDFNFPTLDNTTQLPVPESFTMGNLSGEGNRTVDVRHVPRLYG
jgi:hypothetical protein